MKYIATVAGFIKESLTVTPPMACETKNLD